MATSDKYDRQLRLWGSDGQRALMEGHILLVNADAAGSETLKNLVLPGVGLFTVMDDQCVTIADCGSNFFVTQDQIGQPRAMAVTGLLCEMNSDVVGIPILLQTETATEAVTSHIRSTAFATVVLSNPNGALLHAVSAVCWEQRTPLVVIRTCGLIGYMRLQLREQHVTASATDLYDLRIFNPFPELHDFCTGFNLSELSDAEHAHVPYIVILYQALQRWKSEHSGLMPHTYVDKKLFAQTVQNMARKRATEVNFEEALNNSFRSYAPIRVPENIIDLMDGMDKVPTQGISDFRLLLTALKVYMERHGGDAPLPGNIPDMTSTSECFIQLQQRYHKKAEADREEFRQIVGDMVLHLGRHEIAADTVDLFCRSVYALGFMHSSCPITPFGTDDVSVETKALEAERVSNNIQQYFGDLYEDSEQTPIIWWFLVIAAEEFQARHGRWPGAVTSNDPSVLEEDAKLLWDCVHSIVSEKVPSPPRLHTPVNTEPVYVKRPLLESTESSELTAHTSLPDTLLEQPDISMKYCREMVRFGDCVLHNIASVMGGVASQEVAKIITHKFMPINNTFIFNGICGVAGTYEL